MVVGKRFRSKLRAERIIELILEEMSAEFQISHREILETERGGENLWFLMAVCLMTEFSGVRSHAVAAAFGKRSSRTVGAGARFRKYLRFIPDLRLRMQRVRRALQKKLMDLDV